MGFNRRKLEVEQKGKTDAVLRRATDAQVLEDAERLIAAWNERLIEIPARRGRLVIGKPR